MMNVVKLLEEVACKPMPLSGEVLAATLANATLDVSEQTLAHVTQALLSSDAHALNVVLGGRERMYCAVFLPENDEPNEEPLRKGDDEVPDEETSVRAA